MGLIKGPITWRYYAQEITRRLNIEPRLFKRYWKQPEVATQELTESWNTTEVLELDRSELMLLTLLLDHPEWLGAFEREEMGNLLESAELAEFLRIAEAYVAEHGQLDVPVLLEKVGTAFASILTGASTQVQETYEADKASQMYAETLRTLKRRWAERSVAQHESYSDQLDFQAQREEFVAVQRQIAQLRQFHQAHVTM